ncbi:MAG: hypothetical protein U0800_10350 [Isosphaeraceae bacterium]
MGAAPVPDLADEAARIVVERTMLSSTRITRFLSTSGRGVNLTRTLAGAVGVALDEGPKDVSVADQALDRGDPQPGHRVGRRLGGVGNRDNDRVLIQRHGLLLGEFSPEACPDDVH